MKKKFLVILLALAMAFSAVACGNNDEVVNDGRETTAKEDINDAADSIKNGVDDTGDAIKDGVRDTGDAIKDSADDMMDGRDDVNDNVNDDNTHNN